MKELLQQYAAYNIWAHKILFDRINQLSEEQITAAIVSSFPSIYKTAVHLWQAENVWWQRLQKIENITLLSTTFNGSFSELTEGLLQQSRQWKQWVDNAPDDDLNAEFTFLRNNEQITIVVKDMLLHIFNHATMHRGQLVTFLRQLGEVDKIPSTDFSTFCRTRK
jgi:uncharacterized damage-inducible protein DinB